MAGEPLTESTLAHGEAPPEGGLPQMNVDTYASQLFWLLVTFTILLVVLSRIAMPNIRGALEGRQNRIRSDIEAAEELHRQAKKSHEDYETALANARTRALAIANENRKEVVDEIERQKAEAEAKNQAALADAEKKIAAARERAAVHVRDSARDAAVEIVDRLIGERVSADDAAKAVEIRG